MHHSPLTPLTPIIAHDTPPRDTPPRDTPPHDTPPRDTPPHDIICNRHHIQYFSKQQPFYLFQKYHSEEHQTI